MGPFKNKKGMTLVELLVSLFILVVVITLAGTMLLNANKFFNTSASLGMDQLSADGVYRMANDRLTYATKIILTPDRDESLEKGGWHWITINEEGHFLLDGKDVFDKEYYHGNTMEMEAYADGSYRLFVSFSMKKRSKTYQTGAVFEAVNIRAAGQWGTEMENSRKAIQAVYRDGTLINQAKPLSSGSGAYIYYENEYQRIYTGTITDELYERTTANTKTYPPESGSKLNKGDFVWYNGAWWRLDKDDATSPPGNFHWKKIALDCATQMPDDTSEYAYGDIVRCNGKYYRSTVRDINFYRPDGPGGDAYWEEVVRDEEKSTATVTVWKTAVNA